MRILAPAVKLPGKITISRMSSNRIGDSIHIEIEDDISGCILMEVMLTPEILGKALTGCSHQPCELEYYAASPAGKTREMKHEIIKEVKGQTKEEALAPYLVDGWRDDGGYGNHHCHRLNKDGSAAGYEVSFVRWV